MCRSPPHRENKHTAAGGSNAPTQDNNGIARAGWSYKSTTRTSDACGRPGHKHYKKTHTQPPRAASPVPARPRQWARGLPAPPVSPILEAAEAVVSGRSRPPHTLTRLQASRRLPPSSPRLETFPCFDPSLMPCNSSGFFHRIRFPATTTTTRNRQFARKVPRRMVAGDVPKGSEPGKIGTTGAVGKLCLNLARVSRRYNLSPFQCSARPWKDTLEGLCS